MDGLVIVDKPTGLTSHDVVARARRVTRIRAIGHAGTLDPMATGVLVLCIGQATRLSEYLLGEDKTYLAQVRLGARSNTDDAEGEITPGVAPDFSPARLREGLTALTGPQMQVPPQFSAIQRDGQRAYALARKGEHIELAARPVHVHALSWVDAQALVASDDRWAGDGPPESITLRMRVSSGTYVRSLARDLGEALGCGGLLSGLRREAAGAFTLAESVPLDDFLAAGADWPRHLLPMTRAVPALARRDLDADEARRIAQGQFLASHDADGPAEGTLLRLHAPGGALLAIGRVSAGQVRPDKVFTITA